jgi:hypothetical protein
MVLFYLVEKYINSMIVLNIRAIIILFFFSFHYFASSQSFLTMSGEFTMKEKRNENLKLIKGRFEVDNEKRFLKFKLSFPQHETWILNDTIFEKYVNDTLISSIGFSKWDDVSFFNDIIHLYKNDYGLKESGFKIVDISKKENKTIVKWVSPTNFEKLIKNAFTTVEENLLKSVSFYDPNDTEISVSFFSDFKILNGLPIPCKITSKHTGTKDIVYKSMEFRNLIIN